jgi:hypothetical protein
LTHPAESPYYIITTYEDEPIYNSFVGTEDSMRDLNSWKEGKMRHIYRLLFVSIGILIFAGCRIGGGISASSAQTNQRASNQLSRQDVEQMIADFGPIIYLRADERYLMDDPEYVLDNGVSLAWGIVENEGKYDSFQCRRVESMPTSSKTLMDNVNVVKDTIRSYPDGEKYKYWLQIDDRMKEGNLRRAKALIRVLPASALSTEIQFWFFYPFNGPGRVRICAASSMCDDNWLDQCGRHYSDWERVSVLISNTTNQLVSVYMSRHDGSEVFDRSDKGIFRSVSDRRRTLQLQGSHPVIYSAISSHAHYPNTGNHNYKRVFSKKWGLGTASADLFDRTAAGKEFKAYHPDYYRIISSDLPNFRVVEPDWLEFSGRWGQYEKLSDKIRFSKANIPVQTYSEVGNGPSGPKMKKEWKGDFASSSH